MTTPRRPIEFGGESLPIGDRIPPFATTPASLVAALTEICPTDTRADERAEYGRDWWPLAMHWALHGMTVTAPAAVCRPRTTAEVANVVALCAQHGVPVTCAGGRSGVGGAAIPLRGGVVLDTTALAGIISVDDESGLACVLPGTFGPDLEHTLRHDHGLTVGHFPQSFALSTVGGWVASHGAGQYSTRYGTIAAMVAGLEVVDAHGMVATYGPHPHSSTGFDLRTLFIGSEGTLGVITKVWLRCHPVPHFERRATYSFPSFERGVAALRDAVRHGATPAVLRLYDAQDKATFVLRRNN